MDSTPDIIEKMNEEKVRDRINRLQEKIDTTRYNMEVSKEIIAETPSDAQQEKLTKKIYDASTELQALKRKFGT